ncbi:MAG: ribosomal protein L7/L12 [Candidatus Shikimatogenerans bostrichidophilus]|nr:MAG: ribosomal protein L7/L12 [Candidatus Shikimatogenerans bostrichidophilus]
MNKLKDLAKNLIKLNIKEINKLYEILEKKYNIKNDLNITNYSNINNHKSNEIGPGNNSNNNIENKKSIIYNIYLKSLGPVKLPVIKLINSITGKSLTESKKMIDTLPSLIKEKLPLDECKKIQEEFKKIDADIELKESNI